MNQDFLKLATELRHTLHTHPELSMHEEWTKATLMTFLREHTKLELVDKGRWFYAVYRAGADKPNIAIRADFDAVPVDEAPDLVPYASVNPGVGHKCGHDGHSATLAALAMELDAYGADSNVFLLFQHAEETGEGGAQCAPFLAENGIEEIFAFHNLPGIDFGTVFAPVGVAQYASKGMIMRFTGMKSHACYPENGRNPAYAIAEIITALGSLVEKAKDRGLVLATIIYSEIGEHAFGTSAGYGELALTIRGEYGEEMDRLQELLVAFATEKAEKYGLEVSFDYSDVFPETRNTASSIAKVRRAATALGYPIDDTAEPFRASEDFGWYTRLIPGAIFYIGDGKDSAPLHTACFDFPDALIEKAVEMFKHIIAQS